jgi:hypothetical protein
MAFLSYRVTASSMSWQAGKYGDRHGVPAGEP